MKSKKPNNLQFMMLGEDGLKPSNELEKAVLIALKQNRTLEEACAEIAKHPEHPSVRNKNWDGAKILRKGKDGSGL